MDHSRDAPGARTDGSLLARAEQLLRQGDAAAALAMLQNGRAACHPSERPRIEGLIGRALYALERFEEASVALQAALDDRAAVDDALQADLLNVLGNVYQASGQLQAAAEAFSRALTHADRLNPPDHGLRARLFINLGNSALKAGQVEASTIHYERAIDAARHSGDPRRLGMAHMGLGIARQEARDYDNALSHAAQAITLFERAGEPRLANQALTNLALAHAEQEHWAEAVPHLQRILEQARAMADAGGEAHALELLARARAFLGDHAGAAQLAAEARATAEQMDDRLEASGAALTEAAALTALGRVAEAEERYRAALAYFRAIGASRRFMAASRSYADALRSWGREDEAAEVLDRAYAASVDLQQG